MTERGPDGPSGPDPIEADEDARRLLAAVQNWARRTMPAPPSGHPGPECQWCPLCQIASVLRGEYPEFGERVTEAGAAVAGAVRALLESGTFGGSDDEAGSDSPEPPTAAQRRPRPTRQDPGSSRVQHIRLDDSSQGRTPSDPEQEG